MVHVPLLHSLFNVALLAGGVMCYNHRVKARDVNMRGMCLCHLNSMFIGAFDPWLIFSLASEVQKDFCFKALVCQLFASANSF